MAARGVQAQKVTVGVRPEHIELADVPGKMIPAKIDVSEMMGSQINLHINVNGKEGIIIVDTMSNAGRLFQMGEEINFTFAPEVIHVFDTDGRNLEY